MSENDVIYNLYPVPAKDFLSLTASFLFNMASNGMPSCHIGNTCDSSTANALILV